MDLAPDLVMDTWIDIYSGRLDQQIPVQMDSIIEKMEELTKSSPVLDPITRLVLVQQYS